MKELYVLVSLVVLLFLFVVFKARLRKTEERTKAAKKLATTEYKRAVQERATRLNGGTPSAPERAPIKRDNRGTVQHTPHHRSVPRSHRRSHYDELDDFVAPVDLFQQVDENVTVVRNLSTTGTDEYIAPSHTSHHSAHTYGGGDWGGSDNNDSCGGGDSSCSCD